MFLLATYVVDPWISTGDSITIQIPEGYEENKIHYWAGMPGNKASEWDSRPSLSPTESGWKGYTIDGVTSVNFLFTKDSGGNPDNFENKANSSGVWYVYYEGGWQCSKTKP